MHTSTRMQAGDFQFWQHTSNGVYQSDFEAFCPNYHELDRIGIVSPNLEDGVLHTGYALLALTTAFYDRLRTRHADFFDYPQHFAFAGAEAADIHTGSGLLPLNTPDLWRAWSWLDVWPDAKWVSAPATASGMIQRVFNYQINRLFWPRTLQPGPQETPLPDYVWKMLKTSLKTVYLYGESAELTPEASGERIEISVTPAIEEVIQESISRLPATVHLPDNGSTSTRQVYELVTVQSFLAAIQPKPSGDPL
jgi:hypothetical protein